MDNFRFIVKLLCAVNSWMLGEFGCNRSKSPGAKELLLMFNLFYFFHKGGPLPRSKINEMTVSIPIEIFQFGNYKTCVLVLIILEFFCDFPFFLVGGWGL